MQESASVSWDPIQPKPLETWEIVLAAFLFACLIYLAVWWARKRSASNTSSLRLDRPD